MARSRSWMRCLPIVHPFHEAKIRGGQPLCPLMLSAMFENGRPCGQTSVRTGDRRPVYPRKVTVSATSMTKHQLLVKSHVRHEAFVREFQPIVHLWMTYSLFKACVLDPTTHEGSQDPQSRGGESPGSRGAPERTSRSVGGVAGGMAECRLVLLPRDRPCRADPFMARVLYRGLSGLVPRGAPSALQPQTPHPWSSTVWYFEADSKGNSPHIPHVGSI